MEIRGWVYVISNEAMPGLVKIGFSTKDPILRAAELNSTGAPHPYQVVYDILVAGPRDIEQRVHAAMSKMKEGKEWFRCSADEAIEAIRHIAGALAITDFTHSAGKCAQPNPSPGTSMDDLSEPPQPPNGVCAEWGCYSPIARHLLGKWYCRDHFRSARRTLITRNSQA